MYSAGSRIPSSVWGGTQTGKATVSESDHREWASISERQLEQTGEAGLATKELTDC